MTARTYLPLALGLCAALGLGACSGGPAGSAIPAARAPFERAAAPAARHAGRLPLAFRFKIPRKRMRHAHYLSQSTASIQIAVYDATHTQKYATAVVNTVPGFNGCTAVADTTFSCIATVLTPPGNDTFDVTAWDGSNAQGAELSAAIDQPVKVAAGQANALKLTLGGVPAAVGMEWQGSSLLATGNAFSGFTIGGSGSGAAVRMVVQSTDADGNLIVGPGTPNYSLLSNDNTDFHVASVANEPGTFLITPLAATENPAELEATATPVDGAGSAIFATAPISAEPVLYVSNDGNNTVTAYEGTTDSAVLTIPASTGIFDPYGMTRDANGNLYVSSLVGINGTVLEFAPGSVTPSRTIGGLSDPVEIAVDGSGNVYVTEYLQQDVKEFSPSGGSTPTRVLSKTTSPTGIDDPAGIAVDAAGNLYVANQDGNAGIAIYAPGTSTTPTATFHDGTGAPVNLAFDLSGDLYVANNKGNDVTMYQPPFSNASTPAKTLGSAAVTPGPECLAIDASGNIYVGMNTVGTVVEFASNGTTVRTLAGIGNGITQIALDGAQNAYIENTNANTVGVYAPGTNASAVATFTNALDMPRNVVAW